MKTQTIHLYNFSELSEEAKKRACEKWRTRNDEILSRDEIFDSFKKVFETVGIHICDYSLGLCSYSYVKLNLHTDISELTGARALGWLENNLFSKLRITRSEYLKNRKDYLTYGPDYSVGCIKPCPLTGVCYDEDFLKALTDNVNHGLTLGEAFKGLADTYVKLLQAEYDYQNSDEYISEHLDINEYEFTEDGNFY